MKTLLFGASGFVGSSVYLELHRAGLNPVTVAAPRISSRARSIQRATIDIQTAPEYPEVREQADDCDVMINAAGLAQPLAKDLDTLYGANAIWPGILARASGESGCRFIHVSSAAVQGTDQLDETARYSPTSHYARSKTLGEMAIAQILPGNSTAFRPTSVHGASRSVTQQLARLARSRWAFTADPGTQPTPQVHIRNVGSAIAFVTRWLGSSPQIVLQPSEGWTTASFLEVLGLGKKPKQLPIHPALGPVLVSSAQRLGMSRAATQFRRFDLLLHGQEQHDKWLSEHGWVPVAGLSEWQAMAEHLQREGSR